MRGRDIAMIFQEPMTSLNPVLPIGQQIMEPLFIHLKMSEAQARARALELLRLVGITDGERRLEQYPHQLSGGMRQRVMIAIGLACNPKLIIADEPTTALDVTIQAQILELMKDLSRRLNIALDHHHAQSRRGRALRRPRQRDVRRAHHRAGHGRRHLPAALPSLHDRPDALGAAARHAARPAARDHRGAAAGPARAAGGLPVRAALPVPRSRSAARIRRCGEVGSRPPLRLLARRRARRRHARAGRRVPPKRRGCARRASGDRRAAARGRGPAQVFRRSRRRAPASCRRRRRP